MTNKVTFKNIWEKIAHVIFFIVALVSVLAVALICVFLFANGLPAISKIGLFNFMLGKEWSPNDIPPSFGILPMILGSVYITAGAVLIGVPVGLFTAIFMVSYCGKRLYRFIKPCIELLAGIPSIIYGFFGLVVIVPIIKNIFGESATNGKSILTASILLGIMILPTIISVSESSLRAVSDSYYEAALALGASHTRSIFFAVLPAAKSGIVAAVVLGIGRAIGETMAVIMVAGNQPRMPGGMLKGIRTLTANIVLEMGYAAELHREALIATGVVLFVFILIINLVMSILRRV